MSNISPKNTEQESTEITAPDNGDQNNTSPRDASPENQGEDQGYSRQIFTISRLGHTSATAEFGSPTLVWHVAFWPKGETDPFSIRMTTTSKANPGTASGGAEAPADQVASGGAGTSGEAGPSSETKIKADKEIIREYGEARGRIVKDFNSFLAQLQERGRHPDAPRKQESFHLKKPGDWEAESEPFKVFESEATCFTLWWPDKPADPGPASPPRNVMSDLSDERPAARPIRTDLRVRVLAEARIDYSMITFFIDAGKPWNEEPIYLSGEIPADIGERRRKIFQHVRNIKTVCEVRLDASDHEGKRLIDLDLLPEPNPVTTGKLNLELGLTDSAEALKAAADYLYEDIWQHFCETFGFDTRRIAGETDVIFANFRGLVMSTSGTEETDSHKTVKAPEPADLKDLAETSHPGSIKFPRFSGGGEGYASDDVEPNAVVKAYMPFMRRFRSDADWRDWIACGIFDWRAIYITAVGAKSEFAAFDEHDYDPVTKLPSAIPAGHIPQRGVPTTDMNDRPAPFRFLLLTKFEPNRKQIGRMVERVNTLGTRRLFALKDWSVIQNASVWVNHYGRKLDAIFAKWMRETGKLRSDTSEKIATIRKQRDEAEEAWKISGRHDASSLAKINQAAEEACRTIDGERDTRLAEINRAAEEALIDITLGLDELGAPAVGGLPYRIARSRYYAETFRAAQEYLRVGNIETWWSYQQFAQRGIEPVLKFIESVGERLDKLRTRLQTTKQDILQRSIALQTEATRDNTYKLEQIWREIERMTKATEKLSGDILAVMMETVETRKKDRRT